MLATILDILTTRGHRQYVGEPVTQWEHAAQSGALALAEGASPELVSAAFLHDLGHMMSDLEGTPTVDGVDDLHQFIALPLLRETFGDAVLEPIRLHVEAKRYLCHAEPDYLAKLSEDSRRSLALQGGVFSAAQAAAFAALPFAHDAVRVRRWDDKAKVAGACTPDLATFATIMRQAARAS